MNAEKIEEKWKEVEEQLLLLHEKVENVKSPRIMDMNEFLGIS